MKTIKATSMWAHHSVMDYTVNGVDYSVNGEFHYNKILKRFEHEHIGIRGGRYLIVFDDAM